MIDYRSGVRLAPIVLALLVVGCNKDVATGYQGYVEGEYLYLAAPQAGYLKSLDAARGSRVSAGQAVFAIAADPDAQALVEAEAKAGAAREKVENLKEPRRAPEIAALEANLQAALASQRLAQTRLRQQESLARAKYVSQAALDEADRPAFEADYARRLRDAYPPLNTGKTLFPFRRLFIVAQRT